MPPINTDHNSILRLFSKYPHMLTSNTQFLQEILLESNSENTLTESSTGLKLSYDVQQNSNPPVSREKIDRSTGITRVHGF